MVINTSNTKQDKSARQYGLGALITTGVATALLSIAGSVLITHYTVANRLNTIEHPVAIVDVVRMASELARAASHAGSKIDDIVTNYAENLNRLKEAGYIILDARYTILAPDAYIVKPSELIPGASDENLRGAYQPPTIVPPSMMNSSDGANSSSSGGTQGSASQPSPLSQIMQGRGAQ